MGDIGHYGCDGIIHRFGDLHRFGDVGSHGHGDDHGYEWLGQHDCDYDGESGRVERNTVTHEPVVYVGR